MAPRCARRLQGFADRLGRSEFERSGSDGTAVSAEDTDGRLILLDAEDNVLVVRASIAAGERIRVAGRDAAVRIAIDMGHKLARRAIDGGEPIVKYGAVIGTATCGIAQGEHVHLHNVRSNYTATHSLDDARTGTGGNKDESE